MSNALIVKDHPRKPERISKRLRRGLDMMIWGDETGRPLAYDEAARKINISTYSMRKSLQRPVVRMYLRSEAEVFRASLTPRSLWDLREISAQRVNMNAAVSAARTIVGAEEQSRPIAAESPHLTIKIVNAVNAAPAPPTIEHKPIEPEYGSDPNDPTKELAPARFRWPRDE